MKLRKSFVLITIGVCLLLCSCGKDTSQQDKGESGEVKEENREANTELGDSAFSEKAMEYFSKAEEVAISYIEDKYGFTPTISNITYGDGDKEYLDTYGGMPVSYYCTIECKVGVDDNFYIFVDCTDSTSGDNGLGWVETECISGYKCYDNYEMAKVEAAIRENFVSRFCDYDFISYAYSYGIFRVTKDNDPTKYGMLNSKFTDTNNIPFELYMIDSRNELNDIEFDTPIYYMENYFKNGVFHIYADFPKRATGKIAGDVVSYSLSEEAIQYLLNGNSQKKYEYGQQVNPYYYSPYLLGLNKVIYYDVGSGYWYRTNYCRFSYYGIQVVIDTDNNGYEVGAGGTYIEIDPAEYTGRGFTDAVKIADDYALKVTLRSYDNDYIYLYLPYSLISIESPVDAKICTYDNNSGAYEVFDTESVEIGGIQYLQTAIAVPRGEKSFDLDLVFTVCIEK